MGTILLLFFILLSLSACLAITAGKRFEDTLPVMTIGVVYVLLFFGLIGSLLTGVYAVIFASAGLYVAAVWHGVRHKCFGRLRENLFTGPFVVFVIFFLVLIWANRGETAHITDELIHWMLVVKSMIRTDLLATRSHDAAVSVSYPPGVSLFQYFVTRLTMWGSASSVFIEWPSYAGIQLLGFSTWFPMMRREYFKRASSTVLMCLVIFVLPLFFFTETYSAIYVDAFLGIVSGAGLAAMLWTPQEEKDYIYDVRIWMLCGLVILSKRTGIVVATVLIGAYLIDCYSRRHRVRNAAGTLTVTYVPYLAYRAAYLAEMTYQSALRAAEKAASPPVPEIARSAAEVVPGKGEILKHYIEAFFDYRLPIGTTGAEISFFHIVLCAVACVYVLFLLRTQEEKGTWRAVLRYGYVVLFLFIWIALFAWSYMYGFSAAEASRLASFERYLPTGFLAVYLVIGFGVLRYLQGMGERRGEIARVALILLLCIVCPVKEVAVFLGRQYPAQAQTALEPVRELYEQFDLLPQDGSRIWFVSQVGDHKLGAYINYYVQPDMSRNSPTRMVSEYEITAQDWMDWLLAESYSYVMLHTLDDYFRETYGECFEGGRPKENTIYRVDAARRVLVEVR